MSNKFEVTDPKGRKVVCTEDCWKSHILERHPLVEGYLVEVQKAIQAPDLPIARDKDREDRNVYYGRLKGTPRYVKVVVDFQEDFGEVVTAFLTDSPKQGEKPLW